MSHYIGAIDQGTTSTRFIIFDEQGDVISLARKEHRQICPQPGWVEHDPMEILRNTAEVCANALAQAKLEAKNLAAVGLANQRETTLLWNRQTGRPYGNAVVWMDTRTAGLAKEYAGTAGRLRFQQQTGLPISTYFPSLKLRWLFDQDKDLARAAKNGEALFGTIDSWLVWNLTGGDRNALHITDVTNASRTQLMNLRTCQWDDDLLNQFGIPWACLPEIRPSASLHDIIESGPLQGVPLAGILGDQQAALVGQTCFGPRAMKATYGTGTFLLLNTGGRPVFSGAGLLATVAYRLAEAEPVYALEGAIAMTGGVVQWLRDNLGLIHQAQETEILANCAEDNGDVYFVPAFSGLYAPYWREDARGIIAGLTWHSTRAHIVRAALEATAYQVRDVVDTMQSESNLELRHLKVDGGMVGNEWLMQFQADLLGLDVIRPKVAETTALGAAYAAGLTIGFWPDLDALRSLWRIDASWRPTLPTVLREHYYASWKKAVRKSFGWVE